MTTSQHDASPQRTATRAPVGKPIKLQFDGTNEVVEGDCSNISIGGMFIKVNAMPSQGSLVRFELVLDDENAIRGLAEVVWARPKSFGPGHEPGIGIKFRFLEQRDRQMIFKLVSQYIKERLASRPPMTMDPVAAAPEQAAPVEGIFEPPDPPDPRAHSRVIEPVEPSIPASATPSAPASTTPSVPAPSPWVTEPAAPQPGAPQPGAPQPGAPQPGAQDLPADPETPRPSDEPSVPSHFATGTPGHDVRRADGAAADSGFGEVQAAAAGESATRSRAPAPPLDPILDDDPSYVGHAPIDLNAREDEPVWQPDPELTGPIEAPSLADIQPPATAVRETAPPPRVSRRPKSRSSLMPLMILGLLLALIVFGLRDRLFGPPPPMDEPLPSQVEPATAPALDPDTGPQGTRGEGTDGASTATASDPAPGSPAAPSDGAPRQQVGTEVPVETIPKTTRPPADPAGSASSGREFRQVEDIRWRTVGESLEITITADGRVPRDRVRNFRLDGDTPREVIQLLGVRRGYDSGILAVEGPGVRQIRTGLNERQGDRELRVVLDLTGPSARLKDLSVNGRTVVVRVDVD